jgi:hypothetical protein
VGVTSLLVEHFQAPSSTRDTRAFRYAREQALDELAGRTVWLAAQSPAAHRLRDHLAWAGDNVVAAWFGSPGPAVDDDLAADVQPEDIVVLPDTVMAAPAEALRQRGAHVIMQRVGLPAPASAVSAYLVSGTTLDGAVVVAAVIPCAGIVTAKETRGAGYRDVGWGCLLADVVMWDRDECVGGRLHPCPAVAAR